MSNDIYLIGEVGYEITLANVIEKVEQSDKQKPLNVFIHSEGGYVYEGRAIYNYFKELDQEVNTTAIGLVASIASVIFLAGKNRVAYSQNNILIHLPSNIGMGNAKDLEATAKDLREEENKLAELYEKETNLSKDEVLAIMQDDRMMTMEELLSSGVITEIKEYKAVAKINKNDKMSEITKEQEQGIIAKFLKSVGLGKEETAPTNIIVKTADQQDLDFSELEEGEPSIGDVATLDGQKPEGEVVLADGRTFLFVDGTLSEIIEPESEEDEAPVEEELQMQLDALKAENEALKEQLSNSVNKTELEAKEAELATITNKHNELVNKLENFKSVETVDTVNKTVKKEVTNKKETIAERLARMAEKN